MANKIPDCGRVFSGRTGQLIVGISPGIPRKNGTEVAPQKKLHEYGRQFQTVSFATQANVKKLHRSGIEPETQ
jgi:hypothetical protein